MVTIAPYGTWRSPLAAADLAVAGRKLGDMSIDSTTLYWGESRPAEGGRMTIMARTADETISELLPAPYNARSRVHEYGGGAFCVSDGIIYFSNFADQRIYRLKPGSDPSPLTPDARWRYADYIHDGRRNRLIGVREDHSAPHEPRNEVVAIDLASGAVQVLATGHDFYASPRLSPCGNRLCWVQWDHPRMPWDGTQLCVANIGDAGALDDTTVVAGGPSESIYGPQWSPAGALHFVSDRSGWWNLYRLDGRTAVPVWPQEAEFGIPHWTFGTTTYGFAGDDIVCLYGKPGAWQCARISRDGKTSTFDLPYTELGNIRVTHDRAYLVAASPTEGPAIVGLTLDAGASEVLRQPSALTMPATAISVPETLSFPTDAGTAYGFYYAPRNADFAAPAGERPPLIVMSHGGPTGSTSTAFSPQIQFWTSRGFGVLDVNYGGSTGYGRAYRERLEGTWGLRDVADCIAGARFLADRGDVDTQRLLIRGGSAGGYTTLCALTFHSVFRAGASHYGIGDLEALAKDTHKFEARYLDGLIGPYPERSDLYVARSPIHHVDQLDCPVIFFQGLEDRVVPPEQAEAMVAALRGKGIPVAYVPFTGEQHGFRKAENIQRALEAELYFYGRVLGFTPADPIPPVPIENLDGSAALPSG